MPVSAAMLNSIILSGLLLVSLLVCTGVDARSFPHPHHHHKRKLFVFGDSYTDTGNLGKLPEEFTRSWYEPYGTTFPHHPTGRFSDGRLLTDYFASFMGLKTPVTYKARRSGSKLLHEGMNFAVGGSGVFDTGNLQRNLGAQIDSFEEQLKEGVFPEHSLKFSVALISVSGNDYNFYIEQNPNYTIPGLMEFIGTVIAQLKTDLKRIHDLGVRWVVVTKLQPLGCVPYITRRYNYSECDSVFNLGVIEHNAILDAALQELSGDAKNSAFLALDLFTAFNSTIAQVKGTTKFLNTAKPCCESTTNATDCGNLDDQGGKLYSLCDHPEEYFFWDSVHPTQAAWRAVFELLKPQVKKFLK